MYNLSLGDKNQQDIDATGLGKPRLKVATFGDSTANIASITGNPQNIETVTTALASGTVTQSIDANKFMLNMFNPSVDLIANGGIGGQSTDQMLARDTLSATAGRKATADIIALKPDVVLLRGGSINNLQAVTAPTLANVVQTTYDEHIEIISRFLSAGIVVIDEGVFGYSGTGASDPDQTRLALTQLNALYRAYAQTVNNLYFLDPVGTLSDSSGHFLPNASNDGTHVSFTGAIAHYTKEADFFNQLLGGAASERYPGANMVENPEFINRTTVSYGEVADGLFVLSTNTTKDSGYLDYVDGKLYQFVDFTSTATGALGGIRIDIDPGNVNFVAGNTYGIQFDFIIETLNQTELVGKPVGRLDINKTAGGRYVFDTFLATGRYSELKGKLTFPKIVMSDNSSDLTFFRLLFRHFTDDIGATFRVGVGAIRVVELN